MYLFYVMEAEYFYLKKLNETRYLNDALNYAYKAWARYSYFSGVEFIQF